MVYPPTSIVLVGLKRERVLRVYATTDSKSALLATYPFTAASGTLGPKLREGDSQVPEGLYTIESLNPNSRFHLSLRVGYPSDDDRRNASDEGRTNLGGDIMIHGGAASIGCIAIGDAAIEEVFVLAAAVGVERIEVLLCPSALPDAEVVASTPSWVAERYRILAGRLRTLDYNAPE
jgi:murein L,D-transpeptidase YafK